MNRFVKIGLFFSITMVLIVLYMMKTADKFDQGKTYRLYAYLEDASGLLPDSNVLVAGVNVGKLTEISLDNNMAKVAIDISEKVKVYRDSTLIKKMESVLGTSIIYVSPGTDKSNPLKDGDTIGNVISKTALDTAMENLKNTTENANLIIKYLNTFLGKQGVEGKISKFIDAMTKTSESSALMVEQNLRFLRKTLFHISRITEKVDRRSEAEMERFSKLLQNTVILTEKINSMIGDNDETIKESLQAVRDSLQILSKQIAASGDTLDNVKEITAKIKRGEGNIGKLLNDEKLYDNLSNIMTKTSDYADSTLGLKVKVDFNSSYLVKHDKFRTQANVILSPREGKFYTIGVVDDPKGEIDITDSTKTVVTTNPDGSKTSEEITEREEKYKSEIKLNALIGRTWGPVSIRGGIIQNTAGFGVDVTPIEAVEVGTEMFDMARDENPYMRIYTNIHPLRWSSFEPFNWLYLTGGVDDLLWSEERDYYFGAGLRFDDDDLKGILKSVPTP